MVTFDEMVAVDKVLDHAQRYDRWDSQAYQLDYRGGTRTRALAAWIALKRCVAEASIGTLKHAIDAADSNIADIIWSAIRNKRFTYSR